MPSAGTAKYAFRLPSGSFGKGIRSLWRELQKPLKGQTRLSDNPGVSQGPPIIAFLFGYVKLTCLSPLPRQAPALGAPVIGGEDVRLGFDATLQEGLPDKLGDACGVGAHKG